MLFKDMRISKSMPPNIPQRSSDPSNQQHILLLLLINGRISVRPAATEGENRNKSILQHTITVFNDFKYYNTFIMPQNKRRSHPT